MSLAGFAAAVRSGERGTTLDMLPYAATLGLVLVGGDELRLSMPFAAVLLGAPERLHGGAVAGLLELAGLAALLRTLPVDEPLPGLKPVTATVDYLRPGTMRETYATATVTRLGRRIVNLGALAWQYDHQRPIATAKLNFLLDRGAPGSRLTASIRDDAFDERE